MSTTTTHFVFVDFENVTEVDLSAISGQPVHVALFIGKNQRKIDLALVEQIQAFAAQIKIIKVAGSGRNALDLTLASYLGRAIEHTPKANFAVVSKDKDFESMLAHLVDHGVKVARYDSFAALPFLHHQNPVTPPRSAIEGKATITAKKPAEDRGAKVLARLKNPNNRSRPTDEAALRAYIKSALGKQAADAKIDEIVLTLTEDCRLSIDTRGKVSYLGPE